MATPHAAIPRDLQQRISLIEANVRALAAQTLSQRQLSVTEGDFVVSGGGGINVADGGFIRAEHDNGGQALYIGEVGASYGFLMQDPDGLGILRAYRSAGGVNQVWLGHESALAQVIILSDHLNMIAPDVGFSRPDGGTSGDRYLTIRGPSGSGGGATDIVGGPSSADGGLNTRLRLGGGSGFYVAARDGGDTTYVEMRASVFAVNSSEEVKTDITDPEPDALGVVRGVPIKQWRYKAAPRCSGDADPEEPAPTRIGPIAEDVPPVMGDATHPDAEERTVDLGASLWLLWQAVQELAAKVDDLAEQINTNTPTPEPESEPHP